MKKFLWPLALISICAALAVSFSFAQSPSPSAPAKTGEGVSLASERHLRNVRQLTFGGENAEAYFSGDGRQLIFQSKRDGRGCDQIYTMRADGSDVRMVSTGKGRT
ncbi:MAG TPA: hypothetical protein VF634_06475, partial [Pyrinomonadaceae bacterium]